MTSLASRTVAMPSVHICDVRTLYIETRMTTREFHVFKTIVKLKTMQHLDDTGLVSVEEQDPAALRVFIKEVKQCDPTIAKRYPYVWPVLAYLELYLLGRRRNVHPRFPYDATKPKRRTTRRKLFCPVPIWIRFAHSEKTGQSLQTISKMESSRVRHGSRPTKTSRRKRVAKKKFKREFTAEIDEIVTLRPTDTSPAGPSHSFKLVGNLLRSFGLFGW